MRTSRGGWQIWPNRLSLRRFVIEANPEPATPAMTDDTILPFWFPAVRGKKLTAGFDGGRLSSDGGVMLLAQAARRMRIAEKLAAVIPDPRDPARVVHPLPEILLARILAIACGYEDADDLDSLAHRPRLQARLRAVAGERCGPDEPADRVALRERAGVTRPRQARPGDCRSLLRELRHTP